MFPEIFVKSVHTMIYIDLSSLLLFITPKIYIISHILKISIMLPITFPAILDSTADEPPNINRMVSGLVGL